MGCDISKDASGIRDAGVKAFLTSLASFNYNNTQLLSSRSSGTSIREYSEKVVRFTYSVNQIQREVDRVSNGSWMGVLSTTNMAVSSQCQGE